MNFDFSDKTLQYRERLLAFFEAYIYPHESKYRDFTKSNPWQEFPEMPTLKEAAKNAGLWNLFLPPSYGEFSPGLSNLEYAPLAEIMGRVLWSSQVFNCSAPDTGNMEVLAKYGSDYQKSKWLKPLLNGDIRSSFLMTEPEVASSDARNISTSIVKSDNGYIVNGLKWWSTGALHPDNSFYIVMGKTDPNADSYRQQSMIIVPTDSEGVNIKRHLSVYGYNESPFGHAEIELNNVEVPEENLILGEGAGFEIAQGRLGPGRIHHCMRLIGCAQRALEMMCIRSENRVAFGKKIAAFSSSRESIATFRSRLEQARLLCLSAADQIDKKGSKDARDIIAMIKVVIPQLACDLIDKAIQFHGGMGVCEDTPLAEMWTYARALRIADGPDEVHLNQLGRNTIKKYTQ